MSVPKTSVDKYNCTVTREHDIWLAGKILGVQAESKTMAM